MPELSDEMLRLIEALSGKWSIQEHEAGATKNRTGQELWRAGPGGSLIEEYYSSGETGDSQGHGVIWWDGTAKGVRALWCDSASGCILLTELGRWEGDRFTLSDIREIDGRTVVFRETFSDFTPMSFTQILEKGPSPDELATVLTILATRLSS